METALSVCVNRIRDDESRVSARDGEAIRVRGLVQGVGFRPAVWRLGHDCGVCGTVCNDGEGVLIHAWADALVLDRFVAGLRSRCPPLARIDSVERRPISGNSPPPGVFSIVVSGGGPACTGVAPDATTCVACLDETLDPSGRRYRYPFTNCTHCGPRLSIVDAIPFDRAATTMAAFPLCAACRREYDDPADRRFHAQAVACAVCGPRIWIERADGSQEQGDAIEIACRYLRLGGIVAIKGLGGFQLACLATEHSVVTKLRILKRRARKPFALLARDLTMIRRYCLVSDEDAALLRSAAGPIVIMPTTGQMASENLTDVAPGMGTLGFMLPPTPLHHLIMRTLDAPIVLTSGNVADEPQCTANNDARVRLAGMADVFLMHDRDIALRIDDSVARSLRGVPRLIRRSRGYAPAPLRMPREFAAAPQILAMGAQQKNTFCLMRDGEAVISHHIGELGNCATYLDYAASLVRYEKLLGHDARIIAVDLHPEYLSRKLGLDIAKQRGLQLIEIQHHHAHLAACLAENSVGLQANVLGVVLDGLGMGQDHHLWGGEFLLGGYAGCTRLASFTPVALPGGMRAMLEPWRSTYAHLRASLGWTRVAAHYAKLELVGFLADKPLALLDQVIEGGINSPAASSAGRLFDAVAAAAGVCRERVQYEGQTAIEFEALIDRRTLHDEDDALAYPFRIREASDAGPPFLIDAAPMWIAVLDDLMRATPVPVIAARFHKGIAIAIVQMASRALASQPSGTRPPVRTVALSGGVMQNAALFEQLSERFADCGLKVLVHRRVPSNDGGIALGQAVIAAARTLACPVQRSTACV